MRNDKSMQAIPDSQFPIPDSRFPTFSTPLVLLVGALVLLLIGNAALGVWNAVEFDRDEWWVAHTHEVIESVTRLHSTVREAESAQRGYLITREKVYLQPYFDAQFHFESEASRLKSLVADNTEQTRRTDSIHRAARERMELLAEGIRSFDREGKKQAAPILSDGAGRSKMTQIDALVEEFRGRESSLLDDRVRKSDRTFLIAILSALFSTVLALGALVAFMIVLGRNLASRKRSADEIEAQREWLGTTLSSIGDAVIATDAHEKITLVNPVAARLLALAPDEAIGKRLTDVFRIVNEHTRKTVENPVVKVFRDGTVVGLANHTILIAADGTERPIDDSAAPIRDRDGRLIGVVLVFRDVTARKQAEKHLDEARIAAEGIVNSVSQPLLILGPDLKVRTANEPYYHYFHAQPEETIGRSFLELDSGRWNEPTLRRLLEDVLPERKPFAGHDTTIAFPTIGTRTFRLSGRKLLREQEPTEAILLVIDDVTQALQAEEEIRTLLGEAEDRADQLRSLAAASLTLGSAHSLESVVRVAREEAQRLLDAREAFVAIDGSLPQAREGIDAPLMGRDGRRVGFIQVIDKWKGRFTDDDDALLSQLAHVASVAVENARLYEELRAADRRKDEFLATLAHELRNPLAPLRTALHILRSSKTDEAQLEQTREMMERQIGQRVRLIDDLLDVSRITNGKIALRKSRVPLQSVLAQAVEMSRPLIEKSRHHLELKLSGREILIDGDPVRLAQVVANLLNNSAKYTPDGGWIELTVELHPDQVWLRVRDNGVGIPQAMLPRVFDMFTQVDRTLEKSQGGLGIGLTLVKRLVEMHDGSVRVTSDGPGLGSEFLVRLPLPEQAEEPAPRRASEPEGEAETPWKVLIVDDNRDAADTLAMLLEMTGCEIEKAYDGLSALPVAREFAPEIALLDIGLPGLSGYDLARRLREMPELKDTVMVAVTGWGQEEDRRRTKEAGFDLHLVKPVDPAELRKLLADLKRRR